MSTQVSEISERLGYSVKELAVLLGCSEKHIKNQIAAGEIPSVKLGARRIIPVAWTRKMFETLPVSESAAAA